MRLLIVPPIRLARREELAIRALAWRRAGLAAVVVLSLVARAALGQSNGEASSSQFVLGAVYLDYQSPHPRGSPGAIGVNVGVERAVYQRVALRVTATAARTRFHEGFTSICYLQSDGTCWPDAIYPSSLATLEVHALARPVRAVPLRIVGGVGIAHTRHPKSQRPHTSVPDLGSRTAGMWRAGLELKLGSSHYAPRVEFSQLGFSSEPYSISVVNALAINFSLR